MLSSKELASIRRSYTLKKLTRSSVKKVPWEQFSIWFAEALEAEITDANAMTIATCGKEGIPTARIVLLKGFDREGFTFFTNYESSKGRDLADNPFTSLLFFWKELERQVRITGNVVKLTEKESKNYFDERPVESRLGAWASNQSTVLPDRKTLEDKFEHYRTLFDNKEIPLPPFWGGYKVIPFRMEFWQGRESRLHDRICYLKEENEWRIVRLSP